jgi:hypothetical protein
MNAAEETAVIAEALYDEYRVGVYHGGTYLDMWHELGPIEQRDWMRRAARVQDRLAIARKVRRKSA